MKFLNKEQTYWMKKVIDIYDSQTQVSGLTSHTIGKLKSILKRDMYDSQEYSDDMSVINATKSWYKMMRELKKIHK